jgi:hypothetical protein
LPQAQLKRPEHGMLPSVAGRPCARHPLTWPRRTPARCVGALPSSRSPCASGNCHTQATRTRTAPARPAPPCQHGDRERDAIERGGKGTQCSCRQADRDTAAVSLSAEQRRALQLLAAGPRGCTKGRLLADSFTVDMLADLVSEGLATAQRETLRVGGRQIRVERLGECSQPIDTSRPVLPLVGEKLQPIQRRTSDS